MDFHIPIDFSLYTLTVTSLLPFCYFIYQTKFWTRPDILKRSDILLVAVAALLLTVILFKMVELQGKPFLHIHFALLHLVGPILCILIVRRTKLERWLAEKSKGQSHERRGPTEQTQQFIPVGVKNGVDRISWDEIVINEDIKQELLATIELLKNPKEAQKYGIEAPKGMLFHGPPGTGKTTIARAMANTAGLNFFALKLDDLISKWVGESEKNLSALFAAANKHAPSVIFFDEIDALGRSRGSNGQTWAENLLNHLLQLIDGVVKSEGVYIIGATNRVELVDAALKRAGRLNKTIEIPNPNRAARYKLFQLYLKRLHLCAEVSMDQLVEATDGCSGADIKEICNQAGLNAFKRESQDQGNKHYEVNGEDLTLALQAFSQPRAKIS